MKRITDKNFEYTPSFETDLKKKFRKIMLERKRAEAMGRTLPEAAPPNSVVSLPSRRSSNVG